MLVCIAADDSAFGEQLKSLLVNSGYGVVAVAGRKDAIAQLRTVKPHLLVASIALNDGAGDFIKTLRTQLDLKQMPVLCVDPKANTSETVVLLDAGADDAMTRPFQPPIFLARVRTLLRRAVWADAAAEDVATTLTNGPIELRLVSRQALLAGKPLELTRLEFDLLAHLLKNPDKAFKRDELLAAVWNYPGDVETRTLDKHIESLRRKLATCSDRIQTVHGVGYRFTPP